MPWTFKAVRPDGNGVMTPQLLAGPDYIHTREERLAAQDHAEKNNDVYRPLIPTEFQIETAAVIFSEFRRCLTGWVKNRSRDWTILKYRALGLEHRDIAARLGMSSKQASRDRVKTQCEGIWAGVEPMLLEAEQRHCRRAAA
jgi:hypothetical protein